MWGSGYLPDFRHDAAGAPSGPALLRSGRVAVPHLQLRAHWCVTDKPTDLSTQRHTIPDLSQTLPAMRATSITPCMPGMDTGCRHCALPAAVHITLWQNLPMRALLFIQLLQGITCNGLWSLYNRWHLGVATPLQSSQSRQHETLARHSFWG